MDLLSEVLRLQKPQNYVAGSFEVDGGLAVRWLKYPGVKYYAILAGQCWQSIRGVFDAVLFMTGNCSLLSRGLLFCLTTDLSLPSIDFDMLRSARRPGGAIARNEVEARTMVSDRFILAGTHADILLKSLPPIVHIRNRTRLHCIGRRTAWRKSCRILNQAASRSRNNLLT